MSKCRRTLSNIIFSQRSNSNKSVNLNEHDKEDRSHITEITQQKLNKYKDFTEGNNVTNNCNLKK